jgi:hypothetical protein
MNEEVYRDLIESLSELASAPKKDYGFLGYNPGSGFSVIVPGQPYLYRVTMDDGTFVEIPHKGRVAPIPHMRVIIEYDEQKQAFIAGVDQSWVSQLGGNAAAVANIGLHSHHRGSGMEFPIDWRLLYQLGPRHESGLSVRVIGGHYYTAEGLKYFSGGVIDLTEYRPTADRSQRWVIVALDTTTSPVSLAAYAGTPVNRMVSLDLETISQITVPGTSLPLFAVALSQNAAQLRDENFVSLYGLVGSALSAEVLLEDVISADRIVTHDGLVVVDEDGVVVWE